LFDLQLKKAVAFIGQPLFIFMDYA